MECPIVKCHWCFYHILTSSVICYWTDLLYMESFCITQQSEKKKDRLPWTAWLFEDLRYFRHLKVPNGAFCLCFFFYFILLVDSFFEKFFNVFTCSKQNNGENILQNSESLVQENLPCVSSPVEAWAQAFSSCQELFSPPFVHFSFS